MLRYLLDGVDTEERKRIKKLRAVEDAVRQAHAALTRADAPVDDVAAAAAAAGAVGDGLGAVGGAGSDSIPLDASADVTCTAATAATAASAAVTRAASAGVEGMDECIVPPALAKSASYFFGSGASSSGLVRTMLSLISSHVCALCAVDAVM